MFDFYVQLQLRELLDWAKVPPAVVQSYSDPFSQNRETQAFCREVRAESAQILSITPGSSSSEDSPPDS